MRLLQSACLVLIALTAVDQFAPVVEAKQYSSASRAAAGRSRSSSSGKPRKAPSSASRRPRYEEEEEEEEEEDDGDFGYPDYEDEEAEYEEEEPAPRPVKKSSSRASSSSRKPRPPSRSSSRPTKRSSSRSPYEEEEEDYYDDYDRPSRRRGPPPSKRRPDPRGGRVVSYQRRRPAGPSAFTRSLTAIRDSMPDPSTVRDVAVGSLKAARETSSKLTHNIYREVKGLTSSELEQVMLKATRPDDTPVKGKHVERLVGVTYQVSARYDLYTGVLRKLWAKTAEKDWRTKVKALYILHRYSSDGAPEHKDALIKRLRELRRTSDPKRKGKKYFNKQQLLAVENTPENEAFRGFVGRYAHYVLARTQSFGGMFVEIGEAPRPPPKSSNRPPKPLTSTSLKQEHLVNAKMVLTAGLACQLKDDEVTENTAIAVERVASDLIALSSAVAMALNRALKGNSSDGSDPVLLKKWCEFYSEELLPRTLTMVKKTSPKLDPYGMYLPSRMGTRVSPELLQKGLKAVERPTEAPKKAKKEETEEEPIAEKKADIPKEEPKAVSEEAVDEDEDAEDEEDEAEEVDTLEEDEYDEYEYDEDEYYDDGEEL